MLRLFLVSLFSLLINFSILAQPVKVGIENVQVKDVSELPENLQRYSPPFSIIEIDRDKYDDWVTYIIDSTYFPDATQRFDDGTYRYWKRDSKGRLQTAVIIRPRTEYMRYLILSDTSTFTPNPGGEIPYWFTIHNE